MKISIRYNWTLTSHQEQNQKSFNGADEHSTTVDEKALLLPWQDYDEVVSLGPLNLMDMMNPNAYMQEIMKFVNKPSYVNLILGQVVYKMGFSLSIIIDRYQFLCKWNACKQRLWETYQTFYPVI